MIFMKENYLKDKNNQNITPTSFLQWNQMDT